MNYLNSSIFLFRRSPSPHRTSFPSPGYPSLIPRIGSGSNKHVYAPILPSRAYDCTPIPSPPPLHDSQHTSSILGLAGTFSPVRRQSQDFAKDMTVEDNLEQSGNTHLRSSLLTDLFSTFIVYVTCSFVYYFSLR